MRYRFYISILLSFLLIFSAKPLHAAILSVLPEAKDLAIGQELSVDIKVDTEETFINAVQAVVRFPNNILELLSIDKAGSIFNFWVEEPTISNEEGTLRFIGGTPKGVVGSSAQILKMKFKAIGAGSADILPSDATITASDGKGTNVLSKIEGTSINVGIKVIAPIKSSPFPVATTTSSTLPLAEPVKQPEKVIRKAIPAKGLPAEPHVRVQLYPDQSRWYNRVGEVIALWDVPDDVIEVATKRDKSPKTEPQIRETELFTGKNFGIMDEGIWYIHIRFKNNIGWGKTTHYKISLDTTSPLPFEVQIESLASDNPSPHIRYETLDSLSGIAEALILIDGKNPTTSSITETILPPQPLGKHIVVVRVFDHARNSIEDDVEFEVLPLPTPAIDFLGKTVLQGETIFASGKAIPNAFIEARIVDQKAREVFLHKSPSDTAGNWKIAVEETLIPGNYTLSVTARDDRGAVSLATEPQTFTVKAKPVITLGSVDLGLFEILFIIILLVISGTSTAGWYYIAGKRKREVYKTIAGRDVEKLSLILESNLKALQEQHHTEKNLNPKFRADSEYLFNKMNENILKMKKYLSGEIEKLK